MPKTYLALTIGPIYKTMMLTRKTRELWSVSFTFSMLMKSLINAFKPYGKLHSPAENVDFPLHGAGVYPDRAYFELLENKCLDEKTLVKCKNDAFASFTKETGITSNHNYYQVYIVQKEIEEYPVSELNQILDALELQNAYSPTPMIDWDKDYWNQVDKSKSSDFFQSLYKKGYNGKKDILPSLLVNGNREILRFKSIPEISTHELEVKDRKKYWETLGYQIIGTENGEVELKFEELKNKKAAGELDNDDEIIKAIKNAFPEDFRFRHKYFSVVQADGDNVGKLITAIERSEGNLTAFSEKINDFVKKAVEILVRYGGFPIYLGGDDLLFFAPIANNTVDEIGYSYTTEAGTNGNIFGKSLFFLLADLNQTFVKCLEPITKQYQDLPPISLSFGVMVGYYKQPMSEVFSKSHDLLIHNVKTHDSKNYVAMQIQKHSGQTFEFGFKQEGKLFEIFLELLNASEKTDTNFLNSVMYKLEEQQVLLSLIYSDKTALTRFFEENFNESVHKSYKVAGGFFEKVGELLTETFNTFFKEEGLEKSMKRIYSALRFIHFLNAKDDNE